MKDVLDRLDKLERLIGCMPKEDVLRALDMLKLDIEIDCRRKGIELVKC